MDVASKYGGNLLGMTCEELEQFAVACGQPRYRGRQLYGGIYRRCERDLNSFTDLDAKFREFLSFRTRVAYPAVRGTFASSDGCVRYLLELDDRQTVEAVYMPEENRVTLCLSSQVGCAVDCKFCFTGLMGMKRNLTAGEIVGQVFAIAADQALLTRSEQVPPRARLNVVFMGMGEPLLNLGPVMKAVRILADPDGVGIPLRRITLSTSGIIPRILDLAQDPMRPKLAISLNASTEEQRTALMPLNRKYPLRDLLRACRAYPLRPWEKLTFEYVLLDGINDSDSDAERVAALLNDIRAKVNLIPYNSGPELPYRTPPFERVLAFQQVLTERHIPAFIRISRGQDIMAACGQLRLANSGLQRLGVGG